MTFSFGFSGDDIDETVDQDVPVIGHAQAGLDQQSVEEAPLLPVRQHDLRELVGFHVSFFNIYRVSVNSVGKWNSRKANLII